MGSASVFSATSSSQLIHDKIADNIAKNQIPNGREDPVNPGRAGPDVAPRTGGCMKTSRPESREPRPVHLSIRGIPWAGVREG